MSGSFFRRFSLGHIVTLSRGGLNRFHKQNSDEVELSAAHNDLSSAAGSAAKHPKVKLAKTFVQVVREGTLRVVHGDTSAMMDGKPCWEKCRVAIVRAAGGHMIEFFVPPKVYFETSLAKCDSVISMRWNSFQASKPCAGVFCILITEARETTALEMPDHDSTFVLKATDASGGANFDSEPSLKEASSGASPSSGENSGGGSGGKGVTKGTTLEKQPTGFECVMAAKDTEEMRQWLTEIHRCIRPAVSSWVVSENKKASAAAAVSLRQPLTVELPPPPPTTTASAAGSPLPGTAAAAAVTNGGGGSSNDSLDVRSPPPAGPGGRGTPEDGTASLYTDLCGYPWFHGCLSRTDAAQLVMQSTLVSASESRYIQHSYPDEIDLQNKWANNDGDSVCVLLVEYEQEMYLY